VKKTHFIGQFINFSYQHATLKQNGVAGPEGRKNRGANFHLPGVEFYKMKRVLEMDGGDGYTTL
jgi:hypothetical protein